jgi:hypothetical protein
MNESSAALHGIAVEPHSLIPSPAVVKATFPLEADILKLEVTASGVTGKAEPELPIDPTCTRKYWPGSRLTSGKAKELPDELAKLPKAAP